MPTGAAQRVEAGQGRPWARAWLRAKAALTVTALALPPAVVSTGAAADPVPSAVAGPAQPADAGAPADDASTLGPLLGRLHALYRSAEEATERYNAVVATLEQRQKAVDALKGQVERRQQAVDAGNDIAAQLAAAQYRQGNACAFAELFLSKDPHEAVEDAQLLAQAGRSQKEFLDRLKADRTALQKLTQQAQNVFGQSQELAAQQERAKAEVAKQLAAVEQLVSSLTGVQRSRIEQAQKAGADQAQTAFLAAGALGVGERAPLADRPCGGAVRDGADRQALSAGRRGSELVRLLRAHLAGMAVCRSVAPTYQPGPVGAAAARRVGPVAPR
ncbi:hypothetical protein GCM10010442_77820 [Kitasatospora kifunensis]|uniref:Uncharacterized protein n=1 Tax=Kitasatospora kifunensis TaxID=58351 RepID=A0A7W7RA54_KITKI|nr:hypothetical protein [Kitasatospora kifunensis]MBB4928144.1 hypothetical protein [Kitasatospora kifunensis]